MQYAGFWTAPLGVRHEKKKRKKKEEEEAEASMPTPKMLLISCPSVYCWYGDNIPLHVLTKPKEAHVKLKVHR